MKLFTQWLTLPRVLLQRLDEIQEEMKEVKVQQTEIERRIKSLIRKLR